MKRRLGSNPVKRKRFASASLNGGGEVGEEKKEDALMSSRCDLASPFVWIFRGENSG